MANRYEALSAKARRLHPHKPLTYWGGAVAIAALFGILFLTA